MLISINKKLCCDRRPHYHQPQIHKVRGDTYGEEGKEKSSLKKKNQANKLNKNSVKKTPKNETGRKLCHEVYNSYTSTPEALKT